MSFIEKNKVWLLPLLGLGILGVGYMNFRTGDKLPVESAPAQPEVAPPAEAPAASPVDSGNPEGTEATADLWSDLKPFAILPGNLAQDSVLTDRARVALGTELGIESPLSLGRPAWASLAAPAPKHEKQGAAPGASAGGLPELDFLIHGPRGSYAWFGGHAYQIGEKLLDSGYTLSRIGPTFVELTGPQGRIVESTNPIHANGQNPSLPAEAP